MKKYALLFTSLFALDRITKWWALKTLIHGNVELSPYLSFSLSFNRGISWGMFSFSSPLLFWFLTLCIAFILIVFIGYTVHESTIGHNVMPEVLVCAGAVSNLCDRFLYGGVVDFIDFHVGTWSWPSFNIADSCITIGIILIMGRMIYHARKN